MSSPNFAEKQFKAAATLLVKRRNLLFWLMAVLLIGGMYFALNIDIDNSLELWFLEDDPTLLAYREFQQQYGNDEVILAMIDCTRDGIFSPAMLTAIYKASKAIEDDTKNFRRVLSVGVAPYIGLRGNELIIEDLMLEPAKSQAYADITRERFFDDPFKVKILQSEDSRYAIIIAEPVAGADMDVRRPFIIESFRDKLKGFDYKLAGMGVMYDELNRLSFQDGAVFNAVAYASIAILVFLLYRSWMFLLMVVGAMMFSGMAFMGAYGFFGHNLNMVTVVLPTLMMILSVGDVAYVYNSFCCNSQKIIEDKESGLIYMFTKVMPPCLFTSLTNTCGFFALTGSSLAVLRTFGVFAGFSAMSAFFVSMIVSVYILGRANPEEGLKMRRPMAGAVNWWLNRLPRYYRHVVALFVIITITAIYGITQLNVDTYSMGFLQETNMVRKDSDRVEEKYGNYLPLEVRLLTGKTDGIKTVDFLTRLEKTHNDLEAVDGIERAASILDVMKKLNQVMSDGTMETYRVPETDFAISQLLMLYESDPDHDLEFMTNSPKYSEARLTVRVPMVSAAGLRDFETIVNRVLKENFAEANVTWQFGGYVPLYARIISYVTWSQISSFALAFVFVFGAITLLFRKFKAMVLIVIPNLFPITMTMGLMGLTGVNLDIATVTIAAIALGLVVDDTIHELYQFYDPSRSKLSPTDAIVDALKEAGPAVVSTSLVYSIGFLFMVFASVKSVVFFGLLLSFTIIMALVAEFTVLPAQIYVLRNFIGTDFNKTADDSQIEEELVADDTEPQS